MGDATCKFFLLRANGRRRKNYITKLDSPSGEVSDHGDKAKLICDHFNSLLGTPPTHGIKMNWAALGIPSSNLQHLDFQFSTKEVKRAVFDIHDEKAPGPDGFIGGFFKRFWSLIADDICNALNQLHQLRGD